MKVLIYNYTINYLKLHELSEYLQLGLFFILEVIICFNEKCKILFKISINRRGIL